MNTHDSQNSQQIQNRGATAPATSSVVPAVASAAATLYAFPVDEKALTTSSRSKRLITDMPKKQSGKPLNQGKLTKGLSIDEPLYRAVLHQAQVEARSFSFIVCRAIQRDLQTPAMPHLQVMPQAVPDELMSAAEVGRKLRISIWTVRRRARTPGDPLRLAKSRLGKIKPMQFHRSKIEELERKLSHVA